MAIGCKLTKGGEEVNCGDKKIIDNSLTVKLCCQVAVMRLL